MILVDSDVLIAHLRGHPAARDWLLTARRDTGPLAVSSISIASESPTALGRRWVPPAAGMLPTQLVMAENRELAALPGQRLTRRVLVRR